ncbi:MAG: hypothetical protein JO202_02295 [Ktedonobacteraceae bacterium]|nr:hypothetical protein [Ktedonobacteraceae bacterium]
MTNGRLVDVLNHLPSGTRLSTTRALERVARHRLVDASILAACSLVVDAHLQDSYACLSTDRTSILVSLESPWRAFTLNKKKGI